MIAADDPRHGTANGYTNHKCRCEACRDAHTAYLRDNQIGPYRPSVCPDCGGLKNVSSTRCHICWDKLREAKHGTEARYSRCWCDECKEAARIARARRRARASLR